MKNLKKIKLHEGDQVLNDLQLKKIVGGEYIDPHPPGWNYCDTLKCHTDLGYEDCYGACRCKGGKCVHVVIG